MPTNNAINAPIPFSPSNGGTGISNLDVNTLTLGGVVDFGNDFTTTGSTIAFSAAAPVTLALPASGTLIATPGSTSITTVGTITTGTWNGTIIAPAFGGTGIANTNTLSLGSNDIAFTTTGATTLTLPASGTLIATPGSTSITTVGTITTGTWNGTIIAPAFGGTGVNNGTSTLTYGDNIAFTTSGATALTLPVSGTVLVAPGSASITTVGTITTGTWNGTVIAPAFGGTGINNGTSTLTYGNNIVFTTSGATALTLPTGPGTVALTNQVVNWSLVAANTSVSANSGSVVTTGTVGSPVVLTLPSTATVGDTFQVVTQGLTSAWSIAQNSATTVIRYGISSTTSGLTGTLSSSATGDAVTLVCTETAPVLEFTVVASQGNLTYV